jgi:2-amino-4-hydroxy-6-hydroxymethyldihydropteridine diphosphokinase
MPRPAQQTAYIALGSNLDDRLGHLRAAAQALADHPNIQVSGQSRIYETVPVGGPAGQGLFLNAVLRLETSLRPRELLNLLLVIEQRQGRVRDIHDGPRTLDLDLLLYDAQIIQEPGLIVPHPRLAERAFVLAPLAELAPDLKAPGRKDSVKELLQLVDRSGVLVTKLEL